MSASSESGTRQLPPESDAPRRIRLILSRGIDLRNQASELPFEIHRYEDTTLFPDLCEGAWSNVLLVDLTLLPMSETAQLRARIEQLNHSFTIALSDKDTLNCEEIIHMGFAGLLRRDELPEKLVRAVEAVVSGQLWFPREMLSRVVRVLLSEEGKNRLKSREVEILKLIGSGLNNQQIADTLFISRETVRWHVRGLYAKLGIKDRHSAREYCRSIQRAGKAKPVRPQTGDDPRHSETAS